MKKTTEAAKFKLNGCGFCFAVATELESWKNIRIELNSEIILHIYMHAFQRILCKSVILIRLDEYYWIVLANRQTQSANGHL